MMISSRLPVKFSFTDLIAEKTYPCDKACQTINIMYVCSKNTEIQFPVDRFSFKNKIKSTIEGETQFDFELNFGYKS